MPTERTRTCPRCDGQLQVTKQSIDVAELSQPVGWAPIRRRCVNNRQLTAADFPETG